MSFVSNIKEKKKEIIVGKEELVEPENNSAYILFFNFLKKNISFNIPQFINEVEKFKKIEDLKNKKKEANKIFDFYFLNSSSKYLNLPVYCKLQIKGNLSNINNKSKKKLFFYFY